MVGNALALQHHAIAIGLDPCPVRTADQLVKRHPGNLSGNVPERDVDT